MNISHIDLHGQDVHVLPDSHVEDERGCNCDDVAKLGMTAERSCQALGNSQTRCNTTNAFKYTKPALDSRSVTSISSYIHSPHKGDSLGAKPGMIAWDVGP